jgi:hypothetical protein
MRTVGRIGSEGAGFGGAEREIVPLDWWVADGAGDFSRFRLRNAGGTIACCLVLDSRICTEVGLSGMLKYRLTRSDPLLSGIVFEYKC